MPNYYDILGVPKDASEKDIRSAFRRLARKHHPDVNKGDSGAGEKFKEINEAYSVLSDPDSRKKYDRYGDDWKHADQYDQMGWQAGRQTGQPGGRQGTHFRWSSRGGEDPFSVFGGRGDGTFEDLFGDAQGFAQPPPPPPPVEHPVEITLEEAFHGTNRTVRLQDGPRLEVKIPAGVDTGSRIHIPGNGNQRRDFYLVITVKEHPSLRRQGRNLYSEVTVPLDDAVLGGEMTVPTLTGKVALTIPPGTPNGRRFRLSGQGMPQFNSSGNGSGKRGDLYATVNVELPTGLDAEDLELFKRLRKRRLGNEEPTAGVGAETPKGPGPEESGNKE